MVPKMNRIIAFFVVGLALSWVDLSATSQESSNTLNSTQAINATEHSSTPETTNAPLSPPTTLNENSSAMLQDKDSKVIYLSPKSNSSNAKTEASSFNDTSTYLPEEFSATSIEEKSTIGKAYVESATNESRMLSSESTEDRPTSASMLDKSDRKSFPTTSNPDHVAETNQTEVNPANNMSTEKNLPSEEYSNINTANFTGSITTVTRQMEETTQIASNFSTKPTKLSIEKNDDVKLNVIHLEKVKTVKRDTHSKVIFPGIYDSTDNSKSSSDITETSSDHIQRTKTLSSENDDSLATTTVLSVNTLSSTEPFINDDSTMSSHFSEETTIKIHSTEDNDAVTDSSTTSLVTMDSEKHSTEMKMVESSENTLPTTKSTDSTDVVTLNSEESQTNVKATETTSGIDSTDEISTTSVEEVNPRMKLPSRSREQRSSESRLLRQATPTDISLLNQQASTIPFNNYDTPYAKSIATEADIAERNSTDPTELYDASDETSHHTTDRTDENVSLFGGSNDPVEHTPHIESATDLSTESDKRTDMPPRGNILLTVMSTDNFNQQENHLSDYSTAKMDVMSFMNTKSQSNDKALQDVLNKQKVLENNSSNQSAPHIISDKKSVANIDTKIVDELKNVPQIQEDSASQAPSIYTPQELQKEKQDLSLFDVVSDKDELKIHSPSQAPEDQIMNDAPLPTPDSSSPLYLADHGIKVENSVQPQSNKNDEPHSSIFISLANDSASEESLKYLKDFSVLHPVVLQPTDSSVKLPTVISHSVIESMSPSNTPSIQENLHKEDTSSETLTPTSESIVNASTLNSLNGHSEVIIRTSVSIGNITLKHFNDSSNGKMDLQTVDTVRLQPVTVDSNVDKQSSSPGGDSSFSVQLDRQNDSVSNGTGIETPEQNTSVLLLETTTTPVPAPPRILKPKIRFSGDAGATRAPISRNTPNRRPTSDQSGTPVSIFKKSRSRTRIASITSSTTPGSIRKYSFHTGTYKPLHIVGTETIVFSLPPTTTPLTTTEAEEEEEEEEGDDEEDGLKETISLGQPLFEEEDMLTKVAGELVVEKGLHWRIALNNRNSPEFKKQSGRMLKTLQEIFEDTPLSNSLHSIEIDGFMRKSKKNRSVIIDYSLYIKKTVDPVDGTFILSLFNDKLVNNTYGRYLFDPVSIKIVSMEPVVIHIPTETPDVEPPIPQWAIAVIVIGAASFIFIVLFAAVTAYGRHHMRRRYANKLNDDDVERSDDSRDWENKLGTAAYENLAADGIYDVDDNSSVENVKRSYLVD